MRAMQQRGWLVTGDQTAWHLSRAGAARVHVKEGGPYAPWRQLADADYPRTRYYDENATNNIGGAGTYCTVEQHVARLDAAPLAG
ncbi:hypothetical protein AB0N77_21320 [Streptomyces misionensis]|uniref:hypothetical protein n=1 Tax=Streptomyces misionensis TaxID=67331 RepID=UPI00344AAC62